MSIAFLKQQGIEKRPIFQIDVCKRALVAIGALHVIFQSNPLARERFLRKSRGFLAEILDFGSSCISGFWRIDPDQADLFFFTSTIDYPEGIPIDHFGNRQKSGFLLGLYLKQKGEKTKK